MSLEASRRRLRQTCLVDPGTSAADEVLAATLAGLPSSEHGYLVAASDAVPARFDRIGDAGWLASQIQLQARRWPSVDRRVRATLWWYSVSQVFLTPTVASLFVTGEPLSARPGDVLLNRFEDGTILSARSLAVLRGDPVAAAAGALREGFAFAIPLLARASAARELPLWAIATDSLANRLLWLGRATGDVAGAITLSTALARLIGSPLPTPRYVEVARRAPRTGQAWFVRRSSCCLIYFEPGVAKCASCPRLAPAKRTALLKSAADGN